MKNKSLRFWKYTPLCINILFSLMPAPTLAGPPFKTDDPQPVDYLHWEFYVASVQQIGRHEIDATCPHFEVNYGVIPNMQLHVLLPFGYVHTDAATHFGLSDAEIGIKYRFVEETESHPQVGLFPLLELPTGDENKQLGTGKIQACIPIWIQKSWGKLTTYAGGGFWYNPGPQRKNWVFTGWEVQYDFSSVVTLGGEFYYQTADAENAESKGGFNLGGFINLNEYHHILFSFGSSVSGPEAITGYIGYQLTI
jgi:hypothetical protein